MSSIVIVRSHGQPVKVPVRHGEVDLCALSNDFFGVLQDELAPGWLSSDNIARLELVLDERTDSNRIEDQRGKKICALRVPPGPSSGIRFNAVGKTTIDVNTTKIVTFDFHDEDVQRTIGTGDCQLTNPIGHYDLEVSAK